MKKNSSGFKKEECGAILNAIMRTRKIIFNSIAAGAAAGMCIVAGCGRDYPPPPSERNQLVLRFFDAMKNHDAAAASTQGEKLQALKYEQVEKLIVVQQSNHYVQQAQKSLSSGDVEGALKAVEEGIRIYPENRTLIRIRGMLRRLRNAPMLFETMRNAKDSSAMAAALTAATTGLSGISTAQTERYFRDYRVRIAEVAAAEAKNPAEPVVPSVEKP